MTAPDATTADADRDRAHAAREALVGKTIAGRYILRGLLGHGGMGAVYEAEHVGLGKRAAIKFVDPEFATDEKVVARFAREARAMSAIESAHIVTVFDAGTEDGRPYLVMELLRGEDLGQRLRRLTRIPLGEAMHVIAQVLKGLARAHAAGIVHRDLKPDNVFLVKGDTDPLFAKIVDFGISKIERPRDTTSPLALTGRGTVLGTPFYMSPEQAQASPDVDRRTDLYSVGAILFECLTGRPPHTGESYEQVILSICMRDAPEVRAIEPSVPAPISAFVARALARDRAKRFASAEAMLAALHEVAPEERARVPLDPVAEPVAKPVVNALDATMIDGGSPVRSSRPSIPEEGSGVSAATQLGMGSLDAVSGAAALPIGVKASAKADASADADADASAKAKAKAGAKAKADAPRDSGGKRPSGERVRASSSSSSSSKAAGGRPIGVALVTAAIATLAGVGVTFGVIATLDKKAPVAPAMTTTSMTTSMTAAASSSAERVVPSAALSTTTSAMPSTAPSAATSAASASPSSAPPSTASAKPGTPSTTVRSGTGNTHPVPRPTSTKPLDIQRDLP
ncbi:MAG: eukaryotic-like serine/threonine-protein kinase [Myxococcales bacterium]|nr:eukaryotic-like serine/threonine-protein kinase [Myxococcales bacterium]